MFSKTPQTLFVLDKSVKKCKIILTNKCKKHYIVSEEKMMELTFSITELSNLTGKTRPTIYKYLKAYQDCKYDDLPYSFIQLFSLMEKSGVSRKEIIEYCLKNFKSVDEDIKVNEIVNLIKENKNKIDLDNLKGMLEEEINK